MVVCLMLDGKVIGSKLIAQEFTSDKFFHSRPAANSTSGVDPHITPEDAFSQIPRISRATGLEVNTLKTIIQLDIERNKVSNVLVFAPPYMNVLQVNLDLITGYPKIYQEFTKLKRGEIVEFILAGFILIHVSIWRSINLFTREGRKIGLFISFQSIYILIVIV